MENTQMRTKSRPLLLAATIIDLVVGILLAIYGIVAMIAFNSTDSYVSSSYGYQVSAGTGVIVGEVMLAYAIVIILLSSFLLKKCKRPVLQYPMGLVICNMIFCCANLISLVFFIVDLVQQSKVKERITMGETWFNSDQETAEHYQAYPVWPPQNAQQSNVVQQSAPTQTQQAPASQDKEDAFMIRLSKLQKMKAAGVITEAEFQTLKQKLIDSM